MGIDTMQTILKKLAPPGLSWTAVPYAGENHSSVRYKGTYDGLQFTYAGFSDHIEFNPMGGIILKDKPITIWYDDDPSRTFYTIDGSVPTQSSAKVDRKVAINGPATVTYKLLTNRSRYDKTFTGSFKAGETPKPLAPPKRTFPGGFNYAWYEDDSSQLQDLRKLTPVKTGIADSTFKITTLPRNKDYALLLTGWLQAKEDGYYTFYFRNKKGARLYIGGQLLVQYNDSMQTPVVSYIVPLAKGFYPFRVEYLSKKEDPIERPFIPYYITPGRAATNDPNPIPMDVEYHNGHPL
jgi:hypothetical protein